MEDAQFSRNLFHTGMIQGVKDLKLQKLDNATLLTIHHASI